VVLIWLFVLNERCRIVRTLLAGPAAVVTALVLLLTSFSATLAQSDNPAFVATWTRTDLPVAETTVNRTWIWGPLTTAWGETEPYVEGTDGNGTDGQRDVLYFDKSRMEINNPDGDPNDVWYVTNGLLVTEMITGQMQMGDDSFDDHGPAEVNVAGDPNDPDSPTYATFTDLMDVEIEDPTETITRTVDRDGTVSDDPSYAVHEIGATHYEPMTGHWVADPFWEFMHSTGPVWEDGALVTGPIFEDPVYGTGYPITEAYWATVAVDGTDHDVLMQCFERRCLTYTPENPEGWQVEAGNVGRHYYTWRYGHDTPGAELATAYMVLLGDEGANGIPVGCGDSLVDVQIPIWETDSLEEQIAATLTVLLSYDERDYGESGYINALYMNDATVESVTVEDGTATVELSGSIPSGGSCDDPRIVGQLEETVKAFEGIDEAVILLNGGPIFPAP
jgi:hypothetical protein